MSALEGIIIIGQIIHCLQPYKLEVISNGFILIANNGKIVSIGDFKDLDSIKKPINFTIIKEIRLTKTQLLLPGLIDTHIHAPQYPNIGLGYDKPLLQWLESYTYKLEKRYNDQEYSRKVFDSVVKTTLAHGTTTACYFGSLFLNTTMVLVDCVQKHGQRALIGKINMIQLAPDDYKETREDSIRDTLEFINNVNRLKNPLIRPIITPRFALSVDKALMKELGKIAKEHNLHIQTHISENRDEVRMVHQQYNTSYAEAYDQADLLTDKTILAHGIYLTDAELELIKSRNTSIAHCPESNTNLVSGLCDVVRLKNYGINIGLGTDVAGGASPSIIAAMKSALTVSTHLSFNQPNYQPLTYQDVFYLATLGGARTLALDKEIGNFVEGKTFDAIIADMDIASGPVNYLSENLSPLELLQKLIYLGDDRNIVKVFVDGKIVK